MKKKPFPDFQLYPIVVERLRPSAGAVEIARQLARAGVSILQWRQKDGEDADLLNTGLRLRMITRQHGICLIVNDRVTLAQQIDADGVHLGQDDIGIKEARKILPKKIIGQSTHSLEQAIAAEAAGADYIGVGPVFATPTKPDYAPVGLNLVEQVSHRIRIPFVAIGGIDENNVQKVWSSGARRIAVVRALMAQEDVAAAATRWIKRLRKLQAQSRFLQYEKFEETDS